MQDIRVIYAETLVKFESIRSQFLTELQGLEFVLENDICDSNGNPLDPTTYTEVLKSLMNDKAEVEEDITMIESQIKYIQEFLDTHK
jgi:hypothetical protein